MEIENYSTSDEVISGLCRIIEKSANDSIEKSGCFKIGLSGGSLVNFLVQGLSKINSKWDKWIIFFCDERIVPFNDTESTFGTYKEKLIGKVPLTEDNFVPINPNLSAQDAAVDYAEKIKKYFPECEWPVFDLLLLGMGPDGHTCSLFPNHPLLKENKLWVAPITDSPKPPPSRITITFPVINNSKKCVFAIPGKEKAQLFKKILDEPNAFPAGMVKPKNGIVFWLLDSFKE